MPAAPDPESLPTFEERWAPLAEKFPHRRRHPRPIDLRYGGDPWPIAAMKGETAPRDPESQVWIRAAGTLPDDPLLHVCVLAYASDMTLLDSVLLPHGIDFSDGTAFIASLDHAMWFHGDFRADEWLLYDQHSPWAGGARGLATGRIYTRDGRRVCSVTYRHWRISGVVQARATRMTMTRRRMRTSRSVRTLLRPHPMAPKAW